MHPGDGGQASFVAQYTILREPAFWRMSSAATTFPSSLEAMPDNKFPHWNPAPITLSTQA